MSKDFDENAMRNFMEKITSDIGSVWSSILVYIGNKLGFYNELANANGPITAKDLANRTGTSERYVSEWLANQAAGGYIIYYPAIEKYGLPIEHAVALVNLNFPGYAIAAFQLAFSFFRDESKISSVFVNGKGIELGDRDPELFIGIENYFEPVYSANLTQSWIKSIEGLEEKLKKGIKVADVGCGSGASTIIMAKSYPNSTFFGFDIHKPSIERAIKKAEGEGLEKGSISFEALSSTIYPQNDFDLITFFACLHDMGDPVGSAIHALDSLKQDGTLMIIEPFANDKLEDNLNPVGRIFYAASTLICIPTSLSQQGPALGAQAGEKVIKEIVTKAGFKHFKRVTGTPFNMVFEAKP